VGPPNPIPIHQGHQHSHSQRDLERHSLMYMRICVGIRTYRRMLSDRYLLQGILIANLGMFMSPKLIVDP